MILLAGFAALAIAASARWNWWRKKSEGLPILMYHKIGSPPENSKLKKLWVSREKFRRQMEYLKRKGYESLTFRDILEGESPLGRRVIITFDDGYRNNFTEAFPILKEFGFRAVFFIVSSSVGRMNYWHNESEELRQEMMGWDELRQIASAGMEIGGHTYSHKNLVGIPPDEAEKEVKDDKALLEKNLGRKIVSFAYPYGKFNPPVKKIVEDSGYRFACKIKQGKNAVPFEDNFELRRLLIRGEEGMFDFYLNLTRGRNRL